jgi:hypothetical protein
VRVDTTSYGQFWDGADRVIIAYDFELLGSDRSCLVLKESTAATILSIAAEINGLPGILFVLTCLRTML